MDSQNDANTTVNTAPLWATFENIIYKQYLDVLPQMSVVADEQEVATVLKSVKVDRITKIVYDKTENNLSKFNNLFSSIYATNSAVFILLKNSGNNDTEIYLGIKSENSTESDIALKTLEYSLYGNFPGVIKEAVHYRDVETLSQLINNGNCVSCVTGIPSLKDDNKDTFSQGLEKIIDAMGTCKYTALFLATPVSISTLNSVEKAYQNIYSNLSIFNISQLSLSVQESYALGVSINESISRALSKSFSETNTNSVTKSYSQTLTESNSKSTSTSTSKTKNQGAAIEGGITGASTGIGFCLGGPVGAIIGGVVGSLGGKIVGSIVGSTSVSESMSNSTSTSDAKTTGKSISDSKASGITKGETDTTSTTNGSTETATHTQGTGYNYSVVDKRIVESLKLIDEQLLRIRNAKNYGAWNWATYFIGDTPDVVKNGAHIFSGILCGDNTGIERSAILVWEDSIENKNKDLKNQLSKFQHPVFNNNLITSTTLLSTPELVIGMSLPKKSLPGIPVFQSVDFGRTITSFSLNLKKETKIEIGQIYHLDSASKNNKVELNLNSLTSHTFVTGSTGAGKSNAVYNILKKLKDKKIPFLIIEPAKGEYKDIFGGLAKCNVYGTNPTKTELLRLNPFSFPDGIHIMEHIDRLIEILNAVWPMYAAMPAILKDAIEKTYQSCGWNLLTSANKYNIKVFPDFVDLLKILPIIIEKSQYATEAKSNYAGALITRISSLTNGYYKNIFQKNELPEKKLFDETTIIDLSRVGSSETKSLLMGIVFLKLHEYRMANATEANSELKHITVLEEAHHLLRKTNMEQGGESANLQGKSVEMLTNAIAEMRTYGEGFIIADQSPELLDKSAIRNTNTKIVFRLPDFNDRLLVGKAQNLNDNQIAELARLKTGCAAVYQNNWQEAVLCQFERFDQTKLTNMEPQQYKFKPPEVIEKDARQKAEELCLISILKKLSNINCPKLTNDQASLIALYYPDYIIEYEKNKLSEKDLLSYLNNMFVKNAIESVEHTDSSEKWTCDLLQIIFNDDKISCLEESLKDIIIMAVFKILAIYDKDQQKDIWIQEINNISKWRRVYDRKS